jgi:FKBP-type peptidyl-prolyl cis-trans isomerase
MSFKHTLPLLFLLGALLLQSCEDLSKSTKSGLRYKIHSHKSGARKAKSGEVLLMHFEVRTEKDSAIQSTYRDAKHAILQPAPPDTLKDGSPAEGLTLLAEGDSATFYISTDSLVKQGQQLPPFIRKGSDLKYVVKIVKVLTRQEAEAENAKLQAEAMMSRKADIEKMKSEMMAQSAKQIAADEKIILDYLAKNKITPSGKTANKVYYVISSEGAGEKPEFGDQVSVDYTGKLLDGKEFDSSKKTGQPYTYILGVGQVIFGWDEALAEFKEGTKATLFIPSSLGYGTNGNGSIPANAVLIFDVELAKVEKRKK